MSHFNDSKMQTGGGKMQCNTGTAEALLTSGSQYCAQVFIVQKDIYLWSRLQEKMVIERGDRVRVR